MIFVLFVFGQRMDFSCNHVCGLAYSYCLVCRVVGRRDVYE